jgi:hypothetical protein
MKLFEFVYPEEAKYIRELARTLQESAKRSGEKGKQVEALEERVARLEDDFGFLSLVTLTLFAELHEKGVVTRADLIGKIKEIDMFDGVKDAKVSPEALRRAFGFVK